MRRIIYALFASLLYVCSAKAQNVTIPDANFVIYLQNAGFGACLNGDQLDTTCPAVVGTTKINCSNFSIANLTGIEAFVNLDTLICDHNSLTSLPPLPSQLSFLDCSWNGITALPALPDSLKYLKCIYNAVTALPALPNSLTYLNCGFCDITGLPTLPPALNHLSCNNNQLTALPAFPNSLTYVSCRDNQISAIPDLPNGLYSLICYGNQITSLPDLPPALTTLYCSDNLLTSLPAIPPLVTQVVCGNNQLTALPAMPIGLNYLFCEYNQITELPAPLPLLYLLQCDHNQITELPTLSTQMTELYCDHNQLAALPALPASLDKLDCSSNLLTALPPLPGLVELACSDNQLTSIPELPVFLYKYRVDNNALLDCMPVLLNYFGNANDFSIAGTGIECFPNAIHHVNALPEIDTVPVCTVFNPNGCDVYWNIYGNVYRDDNSDCTGDSAEPNVQNVKLQLSQGGVVLQQVYSNGAGNYSFDTDLGSYDVTIDTAGFPFNVLCPSGNLIASTLTPTDSLDFNADFSLECKPGYDVAIQSVIHESGMFFPVHQAVVTIQAGDLVKYYGTTCNTAGLSGTVTATFTGPITVAGVSGTGTASGNTVAWNVSDFSQLDFFHDFFITFLTDTFPTPGSQACISVTIAAAGVTDNNTANNTLTNCFPVVNSFDPNYKEVYPSAVQQPGDWHTYTVHFQNTGTAAAQHILIKDTLDTNLDWTSFQRLGASHNDLTQVLQNGVVHFNFPNINLPDSNANEPDSHGWLQYKIKTDSTIAPGTIIHNTASIYFDFNDPVITNDAALTYCLPIDAQQTMSVCEGDSVPVGNEWLHQAGTYTHSFTNAQGCDSTITTTLAVIPFNPTATASANIISASGGVLYQWIDCATNIEIVGATDFMYTATQNGSYAAQVTDANGCSGLTACVEVTGLGLASIHQVDFTLYPNPASDAVMIEFAGTNGLARIELTDLTGRLLRSIETTQNVVELPLNDLVPGTYIVRLLENDRVLGMKQLSVVR